MKFGSLVKHLAEQALELEFRGWCKTDWPEKKDTTCYWEKELFLSFIFSGLLLSVWFDRSEKRNCPFFLLFLPSFFLFVFFYKNRRFTTKMNSLSLSQCLCEQMLSIDRYLFKNSISWTRDPFNYFRKECFAFAI